mmetsp:Transcript_10471/g.20330  ORF Transcript_10471/g.20330 Transcript_10471/m.20330 type:complete len:128 (-) Transcript_10471:1441-1824(-)
MEQTKGSMQKRGERAEGKWPFHFTQGPSQSSRETEKRSYSHNAPPFSPSLSSSVSLYMEGEESKRETHGWRKTTKKIHHFNLDAPKSPPPEAHRETVQAQVEGPKQIGSPTPHPPACWGPVLPSHFL